VGHLGQEPDMDYPVMNEGARGGIGPGMAGRIRGRPRCPELLSQTVPNLKWKYTEEVVHLMDVDNESLLLTTKEVQGLLRVSRNRLWAWEQAGHGPMPIHIGRPGAQRRTIRYRRDEIEALARGEYAR
jgi:predicted DNA-binding transcriptional regulator AlpA